MDEGEESSNVYDEYNQDATNSKRDYNHRCHTWILVIC